MKPVQQDTIETIIKKTTRETIYEIRKEDSRQKKSRIFHNTKMLMENYIRIRDSVENGISSLKDMEQGIDFALDFDEKLDELFVDSIRRGKVRSTVMLAHIDRCMGLLKKEQEKRGWKKNTEP